MQKVLLSLSVLLLLSSPVVACTFEWTAVTQTESGTAISGPVSYNLYYKTLSGSTFSKLQTVTNVTSVTRTCSPGDYYLTAFTTTALESKKSSTVRIYRASSPSKFRLDD